MSRTGFARLPLHGGKAPRWLFQRMAALGRDPEPLVYANIVRRARDRAHVDRSEKVRAFRGRAELSQSPT
jgi:hypothetical protein